MNLIPIEFKIERICDLSFGIPKPIAIISYLRAQSCKSRQTALWGEYTAVIYWTGYYVSVKYRTRLDDGRIQIYGRKGSKTSVIEYC